jgi:hypothetical protein
MYMRLADVFSRTMMIEMIRGGLAYITYSVHAPGSERSANRGSGVDSAGALLINTTSAVYLGVPF